MKEDHPFSFYWSGCKMELSTIYFLIWTHKTSNISFNEEDPEGVKKLFLAIGGIQRYKLKSENLYLWDCRRKTPYQHLGGNKTISAVITSCMLLQRHQTISPSSWIVVTICHDTKGRICICEIVEKKLHINT